MKIMHRRVRQLRGEESYGPALDVEASTDVILAHAGHPDALRLRVFAAGDLVSQTRIEERTYDSVQQWASMFEAQAEDPDLLALATQRHEAYEWERDELFYVDEFEGEAPRWAQLLDQSVKAKQEAASAKLEELMASAGAPQHEAAARYVAEPGGGDAENAAPARAPRAPLAVMYRQIQEIREGMWEAQFELEAKTDRVEASAGHPTPNRYRVLSAGPLDSQLRVHQRVYPSISEWGRLFEEWTTHEQMQALEVERKQFYTWEREEILYVDLPDRPMIRWIPLMVEATRARQQGGAAEVARILKHLP